MVPSLIRHRYGVECRVDYQVALEGSGHVHKTSAINFTGSIHSLRQNSAKAVPNPRAMMIRLVLT
jgi:hypothetical protein